MLLNKDRNDFTTNLSSISFRYRNDNFFVHMKITGGTPVQQTLPVELTAVMTDNGKQFNAGFQYWYRGESVTTAYRSDYVNKLERDTWVTTYGSVANGGNTGTNDQYNHRFELTIHSPDGAFEDIRVPYTIYW